MSDRNQPCPCGSGKKLKKCCGAAAKAAASQAAAPAAAQEVAVEPAPGASTEGMSFFRPMGRGLESEKTEHDRHRHLRRRLQDAELRGTLVYNNGAFFRPPPRKPGP